MGPISPCAPRLGSHFPGSETPSSSLPTRGPSSPNFGLIRIYKEVAPALFLSTQRAFASAESLFRAAGLILRRTVDFLAGTAFFGADLLLQSAHRFFIAAAILLRTAGLIVRLRGVGNDTCVFGGRPRRGCDEPSKPSRAAIALSSRERSAVSSESNWVISMRDSVAGRRGWTLR